MIAATDILFVIPARGGSKRIEGKNLIEFNGLPLITHSFNYANRNSNLVTQTVVTTDDPHIKEFSLQSGIPVIDRPAEISGDHATTLSCLKHVVQVYDKAIKWIVVLQPTNPLRPKGLLQDCLEKIQNNKADSLMTVSSFGEKLGKLVDGKFAPFNYELGQRSQDMEPLYRENGLLYISRVDIIKSDQLLGPDHCCQIVDHPYAHADIDTPDDLKYAEFLLKTYPNES